MYDYKDTLKVKLNAYIPFQFNTPLIFSSVSLTIVN